MQTSCAFRETAFISGAGSFLPLRGAKLALTQKPLVASSLVLVNEQEDTEKARRRSASHVSPVMMGRAAAKRAVRKGKTDMAKAKLYSRYAGLRSSPLGRNGVIFVGLESKSGKHADNLVLGIVSCFDYVHRVTNQFISYQRLSIRMNKQRSGKSVQEDQHVPFLSGSLERVVSIGYRSFLLYAMIY
jgi:hypothetical protein